MKVFTNEQVQQVIMNLIMEGVEAEKAMEIAPVIVKEMNEIYRINDLICELNDKAEVITPEKRDFMGRVIEKEYTTADQADFFRKCKQTTWDCLCNITGLNEFQIMAVA